MLRNQLKSKIHLARVTDANLLYEGSITIDSDLMKAANMLPYEQVDVLDCTNGARLQTYIIEGEARTTGDGYYESVILDPENNRIELTV